MLLDLQSWGLGMKTHEQIYALLSIFSSLATQNWKEHKKMRTHFLAFLSRNIPGGQIPIQLWAHHTKLKGDEKDIFFLVTMGFLWGETGETQRWQEKQLFFLVTLVFFVQTGLVYL